MASKEFGVWLEHTLRNKEMTPAELARRIDKTAGAVTNWKKGKNPPTVETLQDIARVLGLPQEDFVPLCVLAGRMSQESTGVAPLPVPPMKTSAMEALMMDNIPNITKETARLLAKQALELQERTT
jgi:transcriptional regulator with XRE-family HTH domain